MTIARRRLKVKVMKVIGQANAVGPTSIGGSFLLVTRSVAFTPANKRYLSIKIFIVTLQCMTFEIRINWPIL